MFNRQRIIAYMIWEAGREVSRLELVKWAFLLSESTPSKGGSAFYQFVPYKHGPFSFTLYRELMKLESNGIISSKNDFLSIANKDDNAYNGYIPEGIKRDVDYILNKFESISLRRLMDHTYDNYPWYTINSEIKKLINRPVGSIAIYTIGYEGLQVDGFLNILLRNGIQCIIDVRKNPIARRYGFHESTLCKICGYLNIKYISCKTLGIDSEKRRDLKSLRDYRALFRRYEIDIENHFEEILLRISGIMKNMPSVLVCMELDPEYCHRTIIAKSVRRETKLPIIHLRTEECLSNQSGRRFS